MVVFSSVNFHIANQYFQNKKNYQEPVIVVTKKSFILQPIKYFLQQKPLILKYQAQLLTSNILFNLQLKKITVSNFVSSKRNYNSPRKVRRNKLYRMIFSLHFFIIHSFTSRLHLISDLVTH